MIKKPGRVEHNITYNKWLRKRERREYLRLIYAMLADYVEGNYYADFIDWWEETETPDPPSKEELQAIFRYLSKK